MFRVQKTEAGVGEVRARKRLGRPRAGAEVGGVTEVCRESIFIGRAGVQNISLDPNLTPWPWAPTGWSSDSTRTLVDPLSLYWTMRRAGRSSPRFAGDWRDLHSFLRSVGGRRIQVKVLQTLTRLVLRGNKQLTRGKRNMWWNFCLCMTRPPLLRVVVLRQLPQTAGTSRSRPTTIPVHPPLHYHNTK